MKLKLTKSMKWVLAIYFSFWCVFLYQKGKISGNGLQESRMYNYFISLATYVKIVSADKKEPPPNDMSNLLIWLSSDEYFSKVTYDWKKTLGIKMDIAQEKLYDFWEKPIKLVAMSSEDYIFVSLGPNGKDNNMKGDDIVYHFDPLELVESQPQEKPH